MSTGLIHGLPVILLALIVVIYVKTAKRPESYRLSQKWTHAPVLWAATDERVPGGSHSGAPVTVGGGASGRW